MEYKILDSKWFTNATFVHIMFFDIDTTACVGIVAVKTNTHEPDDVLEWKAYIGVSSGVNKSVDEQNIARLGSGLPPEEAHGFFPHLDITKYKKG